MTQHSPSPALSVAMSVYNGERFLAPAIQSVLDQTLGDFEFLILDDGSTDSSRAIIEEFAKRDARIKPILRENRGLVASLNQLLGTATAPIVARMDADDICHPERFAKQIAFLAAHPDHGVVGSWSEDIDEHDRPWPTAGVDHALTNEEMQAVAARGGQLLVHPAVMYRKDIVLGVGGYHAAFRHCEDYDLWLRLASETKMANLPERLLRYRHYAEQVSKKYVTEQTVGAAIAHEAWRAREAGKPDPTAELETLPPVDQLDALFGEAGVASRVRARVARGILHSPTALRDEGFEILLQHIGDGGDREGLWRTALRLLRFGEPARALRLSAALAAA
ncbi:glycosyltransferase [Aurantiacibacter sediminis]|uniref:Glycosyltransferase n=2 Tax=Aurantiacibacter sediminis TaxID=2793064 RepID=A0ABS0N1I4_9SPHN|nr:glycosyltransferase [Aurantiacibacter sediminis]